MNDAQTELCKIIALMDDSFFSRWASNMGLTIQPLDETMSEFRARVIDTLAPQVATNMAADFIMSGYEIDIVSGDRL
jgi:hypothetical protein